MIEGGGTVRQETRHWDENLGATSTLRVKEDADDYRYFREPDLVDLVPDQAWQDRVRDGLRPMPAERRALLTQRLDDPTPALLDALEVVIDLGLDPYVVAALDAGCRRRTLPLRAPPTRLAGDLDRVASLSVESYVATLLMERAWRPLGDPGQDRARRDPGARGRSSVDRAEQGFRAAWTRAPWANSSRQLIENNPDEWSRYRDGDEKLAQFFIGQVMKLTMGQANGKDVIAELQARR